ncbi:Hypothetical protein FKW44_018252, partial [Caligus rogercresseyi]
AAVINTMPWELAGSSYGSVRTYSSDDEDEGSGYGGEGNPYGDQEDEYEEENEDIHGGERSYYESSGSSDDESREEEEDSPHRTNVYEPIEPRNTSITLMKIILHPHIPLR